MTIKEMIVSSACLFALIMLCAWEDIYVFIMVSEGAQIAILALLALSLIVAGCWIAESRDEGVNRDDN